MKHIVSLLLLTSTITCWAQKDSIPSSKERQRISLDLGKRAYNPLSPSKAAFYSAIFPGMGQVYNKKYWKAPIVWAAMGTSIYFYIDNGNAYNRYRTAFKQREAGLQDEFTRDDGTFIISRNGLINAQKTLKKNRDLSMLTTLVFYVLQIVEASVNAHLLQFNTTDELSLSPSLIQHQFVTQAPRAGLTLQYNF